MKGREVAIKVQYPHLESQMSMDLIVVRVAFQVAEYFFPDVSLKWIYPEFEQALKSEVCLTGIFCHIILSYIDYAFP
jgi:predicted unusual protein kinase regulating ubiquinone biosynthesis (AarF/ABC1/UbiB family)